jgi:CTP synthase
LGQTVQIIPHIPNEVKRRLELVKKDNDFVIVEIGGTVGDYENTPFLFAMKSLEREIGKHNIANILVTYLFAPKHIEEIKTKPTQQAVKMLSETAGMTPDFIICRASKEIDKEHKRKIEVYANMNADRIFSSPDVETIYQVPQVLEKEKFGLKLLNHFGLKPKDTKNKSQWTKAVTQILSPKNSVKIAIVGKYLETGNFILKDSYISIKEALVHAGANLNTKINIEWVSAKNIEESQNVSFLKSFDGILVPGGFGNNGVEGKIKAIEFARKHNVPYLGLCYGMQLALIEIARNVCDLKQANTSEISPNCDHKVIDFMPIQQELIKKHQYGGTMRLGAYAAILNPNTKIFKLYQSLSRIDKDKDRIKDITKNKEATYRIGKISKNDRVVLERHRHRYEVNPKYIETFEKKGVVFSSYHHRFDDTNLVESIELKNHPFFIGTQAHPEFKSRLNDPSPVFVGFVEAALKNKKKK